MKVEYKYRMANVRKEKLVPIMQRKYEHMVKEVVAKGGSMKSGRWSERKSNVSNKSMNKFSLK